MSGEMQRPDPSQLRISDADRHKVAEVLREAAGEGRIDLDELDERLEAAYAAKTYADLVPLTIDLPAVRPAGSPATPVPRPAASVPVPTTTPCLATSTSPRFGSPCPRWAPRRRSGCWPSSPRRSPGPTTW